ncbi:MAG: type VI secretion system baseplate subunit TssE [Paracoccaceae bacterium]
MHVFRSAAERGDSKDGKANYRDGDREISMRSKERREGTTEETLRRHLSHDLASLMNTISLDAIVDLSEYPYIQKSIINYGFGDLSTLSDKGFAAAEMSRFIRDTLIRHEPRLIAGSIEIHVNKDAESVTQRLTFDISADMVASPVDVPLDFVAEVDMGAGKIQMTKLRVQT